MDALVIFAEYPMEGVKKDLAKDIGEEKAAVFYRKILTWLLREHKDKGYSLHAAYTPEDKLDEFKQLTDAELISQRGENFSERLFNAFEELLKWNKKVVFIVSDSYIDSSLVEEAFFLLDNNDVVIGPCMDGGIYLLGMKKPYKLYKNVVWGSHDVVERIIKNIKKEELSYFVLEENIDLDTKEDLEMMDIF